MSNCNYQNHRYSASDPTWLSYGSSQQWSQNGTTSASQHLTVPGCQTDTTRMRADSVVEDPDAISCDPWTRYFNFSGEQSTQPNSDANWMDALPPSLFAIDPSLDSSSQPRPSPSESRSTNARASSLEQDTEQQDWEPEDLRQMGYIDSDGHWRCRFETCKSDKVFLRVCDLRKHYRSHLRRHFCSEPACEWANVGFSNSKDCRRHEQSHNPQFRCPAMNCDRIFGRSGMIVILN